MKLAEAITGLDTERLTALAVDKIDDIDDMSPALLASNLESVLKSFGHVQRSALTHLPPAFTILISMLEAKDGVMPVKTLMGTSIYECNKIRKALDDREILDTENARLYRRVLVEAWRSGLELDTSETTLLGVLRHELGLSVTDHLLLAHHAECVSLWQDDGEFERELNNLKMAGIVFVKDDVAYLPHELVPLVRRAIGFLANRDVCRRLFSWLSNPDLVAALTLIECKSSGSKNEKIERLVSNWAHADSVLHCVNITELRDIARGAGCAMYGSKEEVIDRLIEHFADGMDVPAPEAPAVEPTREERALSESQFQSLFTNLSGAELAEILAAYPEVRQTGSKQVRVATLASTVLSETNLLLNLSNRSLADVLERLELRTTGSKMHRIERILDRFASDESVGTQAANADDVSPSGG